MFLTDNFKRKPNFEFLRNHTKAIFVKFFTVNFFYFIIQKYIIYTCI